MPPHHPHERSEVLRGCRSHHRESSWLSRNTTCLTSPFSGESEDQQRSPVPGEGALRPTGHLCVLPSFSMAPHTPGDSRSLPADPWASQRNRDSGKSSGHHQGPSEHCQSPGDCKHAFRRERKDCVSGTRQVTQGHTKAR